MKKIIYLLMVVGLVFTSCDPLEEIYDEIDANPKPIVGETEYTLTDDDYEDLGLNYGSFNSEEDAKTDIPPLLTEKYPVWGKGSSVLTEYNLYVGYAFGIRDYHLTKEDYEYSGSDLLGFESDADPSEFLPDILAANVSYAKEGDYRVAKYYQYTGDAYTITPTVFLEENFDYGAGTGDLVTISGGVWSNHSGAPNQLQYDTSNLSMEGYPTSEIGGSILMSSSGSEDVNTSFAPIDSGTIYYSALINLSTVGEGTYFIHFMEEEGSYAYSGRVGAKNNGSDKVLFGIGASSSSLTYGETAFELNTTYLLVTTYDTATGTSNLYVLSGAEATEPTTPEATNTGSAGNSAQRIGVRQGYGGPTATIDGIRVANTWSSIMSNEDLPDEVVGTKEAGEMSYVYISGDWKEPYDDNYYKLTEADFESIGISSFGSSTPPDDYLPKFLELTFPYAQEEDELDVAYEYVSSSSGAQTRGNEYTFIDGVWIGYESTISTTLQFGHDGTAWIPDNTIKYTLTGDDYCYMADELKDEPGYEDLVENLCKYGDYDYNWTEDQIVYSLGILADYLNPNAEEGQKYLFTYLLYDNGINELSTKIILEGGEWILFE